MDRCLVSVVALFIAAGCASTHPRPLTPPDQPIFWPAAPDQARVRYVGEITGSAGFDMAGESYSFFDKFTYGPRPEYVLSTPHAVAVDAAGNLLAVADTDARCVHLFDLEALTYRQLASVGPGNDPLQSPVGVAWVKDALWICDSKLPGVVIWKQGLRTWRLGDGLFHRPTSVAYHAGSDLCFVVDGALSVVFAFERDGKPVGQFGGEGSDEGYFNHPTHLAISEDGLIAVSDSLNFRVQVLAPDGTPLSVFGEKGDAAGDFSLPKGIAFDSAGHIWVVDAQFENVQAFTVEGELLLAIGEEGQEPGEFWVPNGLCIDRQNRMWIADTYNRRVQVFELLP